MADTSAGGIDDKSSRGGIDYGSLDLGAPDSRRETADIYTTTATVADERGDGETQDGETQDGETREIDIIKPRLHGDVSSAMEAYSDGVRAWAAVDDHDGVLSVLDWGTTADGPWIATERGGSESVRTRLDDGPFSVDTAVDCIRQCTRTLRHIHNGRLEDSRVYHLALTPERILLAGDTPVITDIGTGAALDAGAGGLDALTPAYAAPEQFDPVRFGTPDERTDIYRLGVIFYELLTGRRPYEGSGAALIERVIDPAETPVPPSEHVPALSQAIDDVVMKALATDPGDRYATAETIEAALLELALALDLDLECDADVVETQAPCLPRNGGGTEWQQFGGGPARTKHAPGSRLTDAVQQFWTVDTGYHEVTSGPVVSDGTVYFGGDDETVRAVAVESGIEAWTVELPEKVRVAPAVTDDSVYVASGDTLYALAVDTGDEQWTFSLSDGWIRTAPSVVDGTVFVGGDDEHLYALDAQSGETQWEFATEARVCSTPAVVAGTVYVGSNDESVYAIDADTGEKRWQYDPDILGKVRTAPAVRYGTVYAGSEGIVHAIDADSGEPLWQFETDARAVRSPAVDGGTVFVGTEFAGLYALDATTGEMDWVFAERDSMTAPAVSDGTVVVGNDAGTLYGLAADGTELWSLDLGDSITSPPGLGETDIFVGSADGSLYSIRGGESGGDTASSIPTFGTCGGDMTMPSIDTLQSPDCHWTTASATPARTRYVTGGGPNAASSCVTTWTFDPATTVSPPALDANGIIYLGDGHNTLHAIDTDSADVRWTTYGVSGDAGKIVTDGDSVYTVSPVCPDQEGWTSSDAFLHALAVETGDVRWTVEGNGDFQTPTVVGDRLYAIDDRELSALDTETGEQLWTQDVNASHTPVIGHGMIYLAGYETLTALDAGLGIEQWTSDIPGPAVGNPALAHEQVYITTEQGDIVAVDAETGTQAWTTSIGSGVQVGPVADPNTVYTASKDGVFTALDPETGDTQWQIDTGEPVHKPLAVAEGTVYASTRQAMYALTANSGTERWQHRSTNRGYMHGAVVGFGTVFLVDADQTLRALVSPDSDPDTQEQTDDSGTIKPETDYGISDERGDEYLSIAVELIQDPEDPTDEELQTALLGCVCDAWMTRTQQVTIPADELIADACDSIPGATEAALEFNFERLAEMGYVGWQTRNDLQLVTSRPSGVHLFEDRTDVAVIETAELLDVLEPLYERARDQSRSSSITREQLQEQTYLDDDELDRIVWYLAHIGRWVEDVLPVKGSTGYVDLHATGDTPWVSVQLTAAGKTYYENLS